MPIGIIINALSVAVGGVIGMLFGSKVPEKIKTELIQIFGVCSMGMGISSIVYLKTRILICPRKNIWEHL